jgi:hydrogenase maturation protease
MGNVLVAGIGNIFLGDDAFGVELAKCLVQHELPLDVRVVDFGIRSYDLAYALMEDWDFVILADALPRGGVPGTLYTMEVESLPDRQSMTLDAHTMDPVAVLQLVEKLGGRLGRILIVGCEPETVEFGSDERLGLSAPVAAAVDNAVCMVKELITRLRDEERICTINHR